MSAPKRVLVLYADAGFGHRSAAKAVFSAVQELYGTECQIDMVNPLEDRRTPLILRDSQSDYDRMVRDTPDLYKFGYQASDGLVTSTLFESALTVMLFEVMRDVLRRYQPDVIVSTYPLYQAPLVAVFTITRTYVPLFTVVTDLVTVHRIWFNGLVDKTFVPTAKVRELAVDAGLQPAQVQITGIPVNPNLAREKRSAHEIRAGLGWRSDLVTVLAVGSRRVGRLQEMLRILNHSGMPIQLALVAGGNQELYENFRATHWHVPTCVYNFVPDLSEMLHAADVIMTKAGGLIVTEALACGLPLLLVEALPGQEEGNAQFVVDGGAGELRRTPIEVLETMCHWLEHGGAVLGRRAANARALGRPQAAYVIAEEVWTAAQTGPTERGRAGQIRLKLLDLLRSNHVPVAEE